MKFAGAKLTTGYGWLDLQGTDTDIRDAAVRLAELLPEIDTVFCNLLEYVEAGIKGEHHRLAAHDGRNLFLVPDVFAPRRQVYGVKMPTKLAIDIGATLS